MKTMKLKINSMKLINKKKIYQKKTMKIKKN